MCAANRAADAYRSNMRAASSPVGSGGMNAPDGGGTAAVAGAPAAAPAAASPSPAPFAFFTFLPVAAADFDRERDLRAVDGGGGECVVW